MQKYKLFIKLPNLYSPLCPIASIQILSPFHYESVTDCRAAVADGFSDMVALYFF